MSNRWLYVSSWWMPVFLMLSFSGISRAQPFEILIEGILRERREVNRTGQSIVIRPVEETRFDPDSHLKADPSISTANTSRFGGFSLPLFRGQDSRSSHIFVDDVELQDPYSGLPMIDDIDLRAFGVMTIHKGFSPWNVPVLDPGGVIQFTTRRAASPVSLGGSWGDVSGQSGWGKLSSVTADSDAGFYARRAVSRGAYKYYSDNNTVLNSADDEVRTRGNNDRASNQALGYGAWRRDHFGARGLLWGQESNQGISIGRVSGDGLARVQGKTGVISSGLRYQLGDGLTAGLDASRFSGERRFRDPASDIGFATSRKLRSESTRGRLSLMSEQSRASWLGSIETGEANTKLSSTYQDDFYAPRVVSTKVFGGVKLSPVPDHKIELKSGGEWVRGQARNVDGDTRIDTRSKPAWGSSLGWSWDFDDVFLYSQAGVASRAPSLMERVGNGAEIEGAGDLAHEDSRAAEIGARYHRLWAETWGLTLSASAWGRDNHEVIRVEKVAATRWRARNAGQQQYRGVETRADFGSEDVGLELAASWLRAEQVSTGLLVPRVPMWQAAGGVRLHVLSDYTFRGLSRLVGRMYDDVSNTRELGWTLTHDVSLDYRRAGSAIQCGVAIVNVTNVMSTRVDDTVTGQADGRVAFSGYNSEPLPGRSWTASVSASL